MNDRRLQDLLRSLPRERAREDFTQRVLAAVDADRGSVRRRRLGLVAAAALLVVLAPIGGWKVRRALETRQARAELESLRTEQRRLAEALRGFEDGRTGPAARNVVYLGGDDTLDVVFDLGAATRLLGAGQPAATPAGQPLQQRGDPTPRRMR